MKEGERTRVQAYEGVCIARTGGGLNESFTVRKISYGEGVERVFPVYSPNIDSIKVIRRGKVRRAKLYYLRDRRGKSARIAEKMEAPAAKAAREGPRPRSARCARRPKEPKEASAPKAPAAQKGRAEPPPKSASLSGAFRIQRWPNGSLKVASRVPQKDFIGCASALRAELVARSKISSTSSGPSRIRG